jgi:hypothetical protein
MSVRGVERRPLLLRQLQVHRGQALLQLLDGRGADQRDHPAGRAEVAVLGPRGRQIGARSQVGMVILQDFIAREPGRGREVPGPLESPCPVVARTEETPVPSSTKPAKASTVSSSDTSEPSRYACAYSRSSLSTPRWSLLRSEDSRITLADEPSRS